MGPAHAVVAWASGRDIVRNVWPDDAAGTVPARWLTGEPLLATRDRQEAPKTRFQCKQVSRKKGPLHYGDEKPAQYGTGRRRRMDQFCLAPPAGSVVRLLHRRKCLLLLQECAPSEKKGALDAPAKHHNTPMLGGNARTLFQVQLVYAFLSRIFLFLLGQAESSRVRSQPRSCRSKSESAGKGNGISRESAASAVIPRSLAKMSHRDSQSESQPLLQQK